MPNDDWKSVLTEDELVLMTNPYPRDAEEYLHITQRLARANAALRRVVDVARKAVVDARYVGCDEVELESALAAYDKETKP